MESKPGKVNPSQTELWNCENAFEFVCPRKWDSLGQTESPNIRYCEVCSQNVFLCETPDEFVRQGELGRCVALQKEVTPTMVYGDHWIGRVTAEGAKRMQERYERAREWWKCVTAIKPTFNTEEIEDIRSKFEFPK